jgi:hypothetical protein
MIKDQYRLTYNAKQEGNFQDHLTEHLRHEVIRIFSEASEAEIEISKEHYKEPRDRQGRQRVIRNGYLPKREIPTGIGQAKFRYPVTGTGSLMMSRTGFPRGYYYRICAGPEVC